MEGKFLAPRRVVKVKKIKVTWPRLSEGEIVGELELLLVVVFGSPVTRLEKDHNWTRPRPMRTAN